MNREALENLSTTTRITVLPSDSGRPVMKSADRCDQGHLGMGRGCSNPWGRWRGFLLRVHTEQAITKALVSFSISGHQNVLLRNSSVLRTPGCAVRWDECPHWRTWDRTCLGTNRRPAGPVPGSGSCLCARLTVDSMPHRTGATILDFGMTGLSSSS